MRGMDKEGEEMFDGESDSESYSGKDYPIMMDYMERLDSEGQGQSGHA